MVTEARQKSSRRVAVGRANIAQRWSDPANRKTVFLDQLTAEQRRLVLALVEAAKTHEAAAKEVSATLRAGTQRRAA